MNCPITNMPLAGITTNGDYDWFRLGGGKSFIVTHTAQAVARDPANAALVAKQRNQIMQGIKTFRGPGFPMIVTSNVPGQLFRIETKI